MQVEAGGDSSFHKRLTHAVLAEDNQRDGTIDARAAPRVVSHGIARRANQRRLAHVCSKMRFLILSYFRKKQLIRGETNSM
jgi:hypothetical protein